MKVLIIGSGGREHALAWKLSQSDQVSEIFVAPGNCGMSDVSKCVDIKVTDVDQLVLFAKTNQIDLTIVGPEQALEKGIVNAFNKASLRIFGPTKEAALIETSKDFSKQLMKKYGIPTAAYETLSDYDEALNYIEKKGYPIVIKVDNLASGKGVIIVHNKEEAVTALNETLKQHKFGCKKVIIEDFLEGEEFSLMAFVSGDKVYPMVLAQDHKKAFEGDLGPNTGGMGAYSPVPQISQKVIDEAINTIMIPCAKALVEENRSFEGVLYGGLILTKTGPKVIEFNARFGDPETEVVLPRLKNDLFVLINDLLDQKDITLNWDEEQTIGVVLSSIGYPQKYEVGYEIKGLESLENVTVFHMGTKEIDGKIVTNGGRVLFVVGKDKSVTKAQTIVYQEIKKINCKNLFYRKDIGFKLIGGTND
ncbi:phosphoribosylamine--glycine ligase [Mycoplasmatota bacterium]|nr:phosphoribosylamine--glycine ligase [Mycoplasmatota bacterium]